jgi:hypothetical protein
MRDYVTDWLVRAANDLKVARREMAADDEDRCELTMSHRCLCGMMPSSFK